MASDNLVSGRLKVSERTVRLVTVRFDDEYPHDCLLT
jgi:hypothetical protein